MILSAHQPAYLPWLGYFDKIIRSDIFIYLDSVQFEKNSFTNRNKVKTSQGPVWLSIPVKTKGHIGSTLAETEIDQEQGWKEKHLKTIYFNYKKAPRFEICYPKLEALYRQEHGLLSELCFEHLLFWLAEMGVERKIIRSSQLDLKNKKSDLILDLCQHFKADQYLSGAKGKDYLNEADFEKAMIKVEYQDYNHPHYSQLHGPFLPFMGIIDFWMNCGDFALIASPSPKSALGLANQPC